MNALDTTHRIIITQQGDNRGRNFLVGMATIGLLLYWWITGRLSNLAEHFSQTQDDGSYGSVTGVVLPIAIDLTMVLGSVVVAILSGVWYVLWDLISGVIETLQVMRAKKQAQAAAVSAATSAATSAAESVAVASAVKSASVAQPEPSALQEANPEPTVATPSLEQVALAVQKVWNGNKETQKWVSAIDARLAQLEASAVQQVDAAIATAKKKPGPKAKATQGTQTTGV